MEYVFVDDLHRYKRLKVTRACESCRRRKVKCDGGSGGSQTPCSSCRKLKIDCVFSNMAMKRTAPKTEQEQMDERLQRSENLLNKLDEEDSKQGRKGRMLKNGDAEVPPEMSVLTEPPLPYYQIPSNNCTPSPELANHLINLYFLHVHPYVPILHKSSFLRRLNDKSNPLSPLLVYSVFAMGAKYSDDVNVRLDPMKPETAGLAYYNRAKDLLDDFLDTPRLSTVQAQILMLKYQEGIRRPGFFFRSWLYFGVIIRMAQDLGLNKNFDKWNLNVSREDMICRKRVWQVCFLCDQFMSGAQGREVVISLSNTDIELPHKDDYDDEQEFQVQTEFVHLVRLTKILASVMLVIAPVGAGSPLQAWSSNPKLQILDNALEAWLQALPPKLRCQQEIEASPNSLPQTPSSHFAGFINILYHTVVILLHRPYITSLDNSKGTQHSQHLNMCTLSANNISQIAQKMFEHWGPIVFQYPIRGGNYGVYCLVAASMIHLVNMSSHDLRISRLAHDHLLRTLGVLKVCVDHSAAWDLRDKVHNLEAAFSAQQARQSVAMLFHPGSNPPNSPNHMTPMNGRSCRPPMAKRRATTPNVELKSVENNQQQILSSSLPENFSHYPQNASPPQFHERPLYILTDDSQPDQHTFTSENEQMGFDFMSTQSTLDENALLSTQLGQIPMTTSGLNAPITVPTSGTFNPMMPLSNSKPLDINGTTLNPGGTFWDANSLYVWNQIPTTANQMWTQNGGISPLSISTSPSANSPTGHQSPDHGSPASIENQFSQSSAGSPVNSVVDPIIVASQNHEDVNVWYNN
ncbi:hypothetical protein RclHR1_05590028 [Rhizophagus clarus]|uniref:Fungal-specific transcription factor domain-containing protein n=1 Tax=Rhizophagus clarus TaxID=94130 RepID=A0A2Z6RTX9_9GLOM|nr:hypothetical protein RclHR1_05590028 [Rhizophagus clarus]GES82699.1 fungal-specific transcription factor domain-containing protein [Rhizophagus clarus]